MYIKDRTVRTSSQSSVIKIPPRITTDSSVHHLTSENLIIYSSKYTTEGRCMRNVPLNNSYVKHAWTDISCFMFYILCSRWKLISHTIIATFPNYVYCVFMSIQEKKRKSNASPWDQLLIIHELLPRDRQCHHPTSTLTNNSVLNPSFSTNRNKTASSVWWNLCQSNAALYWPRTETDFLPTMSFRRRPIDHKQQQRWVMIGKYVQHILLVIRKRLLTSLSMSMSWSSSLTSPLLAI